jgi:hypothetical protein
MKRFIITSILVATVFLGYSQKHIRLSFAASPSVNWMRTSNSDMQNGKSILGYDFGLNSDFYFTEDERYSIHSGLQITNTGGEIRYPADSDFQFSGTTLPAFSKVKYRMRYVEIPLAIKLKTNQFKRTSYWGQFGFSSMINISAKGDSNNGVLKRDNINDEVNLFNLAMIVGIGYDFDLGGQNSISTGLIFQNGLIDVTTDNVFNDKTIMNSLKLKLGIIF